METKEEIRPGTRVELIGDHKSAGKKGRYMGLQSQAGKVKPRVKLDSGLEVSIDNQDQWKLEQLPNNKKTVNG